MPGSPASPGARSRAALVALAVAGYPVAAAVQAWTGLSSRYFTVPFRAGVAGLAVWVLFRASRPRWSGYSGVVWFPLAVFWLLYAWRLAADGLFLPATFGDPFSDYLLVGLGGTLLPMLACFAMVEADSAAMARRWSLILAATSAVAAVALALRDIALGNFLTLITGRLGLAALNPISLGHLGVTTALLCLERLLSPGTRFRALGVAGIALGLCVAIVTGSRGPIAALVVCSAALLVVAARRGRSVLGLLLVAATVAAGVKGALLAGQVFGLGVANRIQGIGADTSSLDRITIMRDAWHQFLAHPVLGSGLQEQVSGSYPHNLPLEAFMATGVVGGTAYVILLLAGTLAALRLVAAAGDGAWLGVLVLQYLVGAMISGAVYAETTLFPLMAAAVALASTLPPLGFPRLAALRVREAGG